MLRKESPPTLVVDDFGLRCPGVKRVERVYFYRVGVVDDATRRGYQDRALGLGRTFGEPPPAGVAAA